MNAVSNLKTCPVCGKKFLVGTYSCKYEISLCSYECHQTMAYDDDWGAPIVFENVEASNTKGTK